MWSARVCLLRRVRHLTTSSSRPPLWERVAHVGESALLLRFGTAIDLEVNKRVIHCLAALDRAPQLSGIKDMLPAYASLLVHFDPLAVSSAEVEHWCAEAAAAPHGSADDEARRVVTIPCGTAASTAQTSTRRRASPVSDPPRRWPGCTLGATTGSSSSASQAAFRTSVGYHRSSRWCRAYQRRARRCPGERWASRQARRASTPSTRLAAGTCWVARPRPSSTRLATRPLCSALVTRSSLCRWTTMAAAAAAAR